MNTIIHHFFDPDTHTFSYLVADRNTGACAVIDAVKDFDYHSGRTHTRSADEIIRTIEQEKYQLEWILETHIHADHLSAASCIKETLGGKIGIGEKITEVQEIFLTIFNAEEGFRPDGRQFDHLFCDAETFTIGTLEGTVLHTPGHTPACVTYAIAGRLFVGDTVFMPDVGTARADFPGGDPRQLYRSIKKILAYPDDTRIMICHDYPPDGRTTTRFQTTVAEQRRDNIQVHDGIREADYIALRAARDNTLPMPTLMIPSVQINIRGGKLPPIEKNGVRYIKVPLDLL